MLVRVKGLEPLRRKTLDPKSSASAIPPHSQVLVHSITFVSRRSTENWPFQGDLCKNSQYLKILLSRSSQCAILRMTQGRVLFLRRMGTGIGLILTQTGRVFICATCILGKNENGGVSWYIKRHRRSRRFCRFVS